MIPNNIVKVEIEVRGLNYRVIGFVEERNLYEFNNHLDQSLRVRMIQGQTKGTDFHKDQVGQIKRL